MTTNTNVAELVKDIHNAIADLAGVARYPDLTEAIGTLAALASAPAQLMAMTPREIEKMIARFGVAMRDGDEAEQMEAGDAIRAALSAQAAPKVPEQLDVRRITLDVVPGTDGMGHEVYATCVEDVRKALTDLGQRLEDALAAPSQEAKAQAVPDDYNPGKDTALAVGELIYALTVWKATTPATAPTAWEQLVQACRWMVEAAAPQPPAPSEQRVRVQEIANTYGPLIQAATSLIAECQDNLENKPWPQCYGVPYGAVNALRDALAAAPQPPAPSEQRKPLTEQAMPKPDLRGIDAATAGEWLSFKNVPRDTLLVEVSMLPTIIARAIEAHGMRSTGGEPR